MSVTRSSVWQRAANLLHRVVHPGHAEERARLEALARQVGRAADKQRERNEDLLAAMAKLTSRAERQATGRDIRDVLHALELLEGAMGRQYRMTGKALRYAEWQEEQRVHERRLVRRLERIGRTNAPVLVGPWTGEVGFELLYWIPFVTWAVNEAGVAPERIVVVSRGGSEPWYAHLGGRYADVLTFVTPSEFRAATEVQKKQKAMGPFDRRIVRQVMESMGIRRAALLHPGLMYPLFQPFWKQRDHVGRIERHTAPRLLDRSVLAAPASPLPDDYVAVRFYFSACFPDTAANRVFIESVIARLGESTNVVLLNTGIQVDDHRDYVPGSGGRIHHVCDTMTPERNLAVQTAVIAGARAFVGTYGGYSYLAPLYGVPSLAFYSDYDAFFSHHLDFAQRVFHRIGAASLVPLDVRDAGLVAQALQ